MYECFKGLSCVLFFRLFSLGLLPSIVSDFLPRTTGFPLAFCHGHLEFHFDYSDCVTVTNIYVQMKTNLKRQKKKSRRFLKIVKKNIYRI